MSGAGERSEESQLRAVLADLLDYTDRHRVSGGHEHNCYEEWAALRDEARILLDVSGAANTPESSGLGPESAKPQQLSRVLKLAGPDAEAAPMETTPGPET